MAATAAGGETSEGETGGDEAKGAADPAWCPFPCDSCHVRTTP